MFILVRLLIPRLRLFACLLACFVAICGCVYGDEAVPEKPSLRWWKGNIHTHSLWSDGDDFPEMIAEWYRTHDYHFLALSDHNVLSRGKRWMSVDKIEQRGGGSVLDKYKARFGNGWVESRADEKTGEAQIRLKPLVEFRALVEERGRFIMIEGEEISDRSQGVPVHMNATNLAEVIPPLGGKTVQEAMKNNLRMAEQQASKLGREILVHLNHPNFQDAITAEDIAAVIQERFFEVYNGHPDVKHLGDESHPGVERMWDIVNTIRIDKLNAPPIFGVATDDSHNYHGKPAGASTGRGWVMVQSRYLTPEHIIRGMRSGDFYASSGVQFASLNYDKSAGEIQIAIDAVAGETYTIELIGTRRGYDSTSSPRNGKEEVRVTRKYSPDVGEVFQSTVGSKAVYKLQGDELYVRARVTSSQLHPNPSFKEQKMQAWTQPWLP